MRGKFGLVGLSLTAGVVISASSLGFAKSGSENLRNGLSPVVQFWKDSTCKALTKEEVKNFYDEVESRVLPVAKRLNLKEKLDEAVKIIDEKEKEWDKYQKSIGSDAPNLLPLAYSSLKDNSKYEIEIDDFDVARLREIRQKLQEILKRNDDNYENFISDLQSSIGEKLGESDIEMLQKVANDVLSDKLRFEEQGVNAEQKWYPAIRDYVPGGAMGSVMKDFNRNFNRKKEFDNKVRGDYLVKHHETSGVISALDEVISQKERQEQYARMKQDNSWSNWLKKLFGR